MGVVDGTSYIGGLDTAVRMVTTKMIDHRFSADKSTIYRECYPHIRIQFDSKFEFLFPKIIA